MVMPVPRLYEAQMTTERTGSNGTIEASRVHGQTVQMARQRESSRRQLTLDWWAGWGYCRGEGRRGKTKADGEGDDDRQSEGERRGNAVARREI